MVFGDTDATAGAKASILQPEQLYLLTLDDGAQFVGKLADPQHGKVTHNVAGKNILCYRLIYWRSRPTDVPARFLSWSSRQSITLAPAPSDLAVLFLRAANLDPHQGDDNTDEFDDHRSYHEQRTKRGDHRDALPKGERGIGHLYGTGSKESDAVYRQASVWNGLPGETRWPTWRTDDSAEMQQEQNGWRFGVTGLKSGGCQPLSIDYHRPIQAYGDGINDCVEGFVDGPHPDPLMDVDVGSCRRESCACRANSIVSAMPNSSLTLLSGRRQRPATPPSPRALADMSLRVPPPYCREWAVSPTSFSLPSPTTTSGPPSPRDTQHVHYSWSPTSLSSPYSWSHHQQSPPSHASSIPPNRSPPHHHHQHHRQYQDQDQDRLSHFPPSFPLTPSHPPIKQYHHRTFASYQYRYLPSPSPSPDRSSPYNPIPISVPLESKERAGRGGGREDSQRPTHPHNDVARMSTELEQYSNFTTAEDRLSAMAPEGRWSLVNGAVGGMRRTSDSLQLVGATGKDDELAKMEDWEEDGGDDGVVGDDGEQACVGANGTAGALKNAEELAQAKCDGKRDVLSPEPVSQGVFPPNLIHRARSNISTQHRFSPSSSNTNRIGLTAHRAGSDIINSLEPQCQSYLVIQNITFGRGKRSPRLRSESDWLPATTGTRQPSRTKAACSLDHQMFHRLHFSCWGTSISPI